VADAILRMQWPVPSLIIQKQDALSNTPNLTVDWIRNNIAGRNAVMVSTHGDGVTGAIGVEYYPGTSQSQATNALAAWRSTSPYTSGDFSLGAVVQNQQTKAWVILYTSSGIGQHLNTVGSTGFINGEFCGSSLASSAWNAYCYAGYPGCPVGSAACHNQETLWSRLGCYSWPTVGKTVAEAVAGNPAIFAEPLSYTVSGTDDWTLNCLGCQQLGALFIAAGAFGTTAYCETQSEIESEEITLRGFASEASYPSTPVVLATLPAEGGPGLRRRYASSFTGQYALYDWVERDIAGTEVWSRPFVLSSPPADWGTWMNTPESSVDSLGSGGALTEVYGTSGSFPVSEANCADIVVYSAYDYLAEPVRAEIQTQYPLKRVRKILAPTIFGGPVNKTAQACREAIIGVHRANQDWNANCGTFLNPPCNGRYYPVSPGPELYVVGDPSVVEVGKFGYAAEACGGYDCRSDFLIYDVNGDRVPDGPISRIPATTVSEVQRALTFARDWNLAQFVDLGKRALLLSGDVWHGVVGPYPTDFLNTVGTDYASVGFSVLPMLKESQYQVCDGQGRFNAFRSRINAGVREIFGTGTFTTRHHWPGLFASCDMGTYTRKQRMVSWLPGCEMHNLWLDYPYAVPCGGTLQSCTLTKSFMFNDPALTGIAASVSHMDVGFDGGHEHVSRYLSEHRRAAAYANPKKSVARVAFDAVRDLIAEEPLFKDHALSVSAWGSYVEVPHSSGGGGCPVAELLTNSGWVKQNTVLHRGDDGILERDVLKLRAVAETAGRTYKVRVRENEQEISTIDELAIVAVDHDPLQQVYAAGLGYVAGIRSPSSEVLRGTGENVTADLSGLSSTGVVLEPGDMLYVSGRLMSDGSDATSVADGSGQLADEGDPFVMEFGSKELPPELRTGLPTTQNSADRRILDGTGLLVQVPAPDGEWQTVSRQYPRELSDETILEGIPAGPVRVVSVGRHRVEFLGRLRRAPAPDLSVSLRHPVRAQHSRLGNVQPRIREAGGQVTQLEPGDTLTAEFDVPLLPTGKVRDLFLVSRGVYSAMSPQGATNNEIRSEAPVFALGHARPNPSTGRVTIGYSLGRDARTYLGIYDVAGRLVRTLLDEAQEAGAHETIWDGRSNSGTFTGAGVYFYRLEAGGWSSERKLIVLKR
jgi:hypothetical protein